MAIIFELWAECNNKTDTEKFVKHFAGLKHELLTGKVLTWGAGEVNDSGNGIVVSTLGLSDSGVRTIEDALETTEAGLRLYHHLRSAPDFRFARVGWDVDGLPSDELFEYLETNYDGNKLLNLHCVLNNELYRKLGSPLFFREFRTGYHWLSYQGESYRPLFSDDQEQLIQLCRSLFPEIFS